VPRFFPYDPRSTSLFSPGDGPFFHGWGPRDEADLCAELSRLAYGRRETLEGELAAVGMRLSAVISEEDGSGSFGFVAEDSQRAVLAFRGTRPKDRQNVIDDLDFLPALWRTKRTEAGRVHRGFARAFDRVAAQIEQAVERLTSPPIVTGHSLGAALATLAASRIPCRRLVTFGSPRVGDQAFRESIAEHVVVDRYQHCCDIVCQVPPPVLCRHFGTLHYIDRHGEILKDPPLTTIVSDGIAATASYLAEHAGRAGNLPLRTLADHAPINYVSVLATPRS
jgi:pimeloyl-ACP methyl ester carboxylesterase